MQELFLQKINLQNNHLSPETLNRLNQISKEIESDFTASGSSKYFSLESRLRIAKLASQKVLTDLNKKETLIEDVWKNVVTDFHRNQFWGEKPIRTKEKDKPNEEEIVFKELLPYVLLLIQTAIILKSFVYFFGVSYSNDPTPQSFWIFISSIVFTLCNIAYFVWRHRSH